MNRLLKYLLIFILSVFLTNNYSQGIDFVALRKAMVKNQIEKRGIRDKNVLKAMLKVERHKFVPEELKNYAYEDRPLPIGEDQTISQPYIVALMTELLKLDPNDRVLEIGTGSGYQAAILAELVKEVYTIEIIESLAKRAEKLLHDLGYKNIYVKIGDGYLGWPEKAPFDAIIVTCAPKEIPPLLIEQLKEGGKMVVPVGDFFQNLKLVIKKDTKIIVKDIVPVIFVPMIKKDERN
ncbi:MAG: protein-L-isoaspartate(D-aspartate) O-methyltransferase [Candidatus Omnitrophica bacterium]|nr:protein-L-isoaspartate(D-aspartate) O-methyltransferase [Candidatus Omnitrophota bacterium]